MHEKTDHVALKAEIERGNFVRAMFLADQMGLPELEKKSFCCKALGQMSAIYRNASGTKHLALKCGFSEEEVKGILENFAHEMKNKGNNKPLEPCYDYTTGKYLSFEEWMDHYLKIWDRISG